MKQVAAMPLTNMPMLPASNLRGNVPKQVSLFSTQPDIRTGYLPNGRN